MIDYSKIAEANAAITPVSISGKQYAEVKERIKAFRMLCPDGFIETSVELISEETCMAKATVGMYADGEKRVLATGTAYEEKNTSRINSISFVENCETSAVGRALGMLGLGINAAVASAEEVRAVERATERQVAAILKIYRDDDGGLMDLLEALKLSDIEKMTGEQAGEILSMSKAHGWTPLTEEELSRVRRRRR